MVTAAKRNILTGGVNGMLTVPLIPLCDGRVLVHLFQDVWPTDPGVICAERNFAFQRSVGDDAHFGAPEVVVKQVLEPHAGNKQKVPRILAALDAHTIALAGKSKRLIEFLQHVPYGEASRRFERVIVL